MHRLALACVFMCAQIGASQAEPLGCNKPKDAFADVGKQYGEVPVAVMVRDGGQVIFLTVNPETGTFTIWAQQSPDTICPVMGGDSWRDLTVPQPKGGAA